MTNNAYQETTFFITDTKLYVPIVTLSNQDNEKLLQQSKSGFKKTVKWNRYQSKIWTERQNQYFDFLFDSSLQGVNRLLVLSLADEA